MAPNRQKTAYGQHQTGDHEQHTWRVPEAVQHIREPWSDSVRQGWVEVMPCERESRNAEQQQGKHPYQEQPHEEQGDPSPTPHEGIEVGLGNVDKLLP